MLLGIVLYFLAATVLLAVWLLPPVRVRAQAWMLGAAGRGHAATQRWLGAGGAAVTQVQAGAWRRGAAVLRTLLRQRWPIAAALAVLLLLPAGALLLRTAHRFDGYDHTAARAVDERIAALLQGEQLVAPPPLPPELFTAGELAVARPLLGSASRQWELLDADFRQRLLLVFKQLKEQHGYDAVLLEGYRSPERQAALAALGPAVTQAAPFESYHQHGLAADVAFLRDGRIVISEADPWAKRGYEHYGALAESLGLQWGGRWRSLLDYGHVELRRPGVQRQAAGPAR
ncbi:M15 family metallopeptidase [Aquincola sp. S2]|uniref:M15 family metallopeptidase n=1 Tax=Pseudaquabacterium terrae TaxID=2732868 RepID=A0ABX2ELB5_9BURK|nr:M15 family metallopeptidase [Aquabacterium terrae]NRF69447.1 M15 family metallopeptidase [Aquabacterium terrae]